MAATQTFDLDPEGVNIEDLISKVRDELERKHQEQVNQLQKFIYEQSEMLKSFVNATQNTTLNSANHQMEKLQPIDHKDIKKPDEYDGSDKGFHLWFERFQDVLVNRNKAWNVVLKFLEDAARNSLKINHQ